MRVAQVVGGVGIEHAPGQGFFVAAAGKDLGALLADDGGGAGVLAERQLALGRDHRVGEHGAGDVLVVLRGFGVGEDGGDTGVVRRAQEKRRVVHRPLGQKGQGLGLHHQDLPAAELLDADVVTRQQLVLGIVFAEAG